MVNPFVFLRKNIFFLQLFQGLKSKFIADLRSPRRWILQNVQYLEAQKEFGAHIWSDCSTHEYIQTSKYEGQTPSELEDRDDFRFGSINFF